VYLGLRGNSHMGSMGILLTRTGPGFLLCSMHAPSAAVRDSQDWVTFLLHPKRCGTSFKRPLPDICQLGLLIVGGMIFSMVNGSWSKKALIAGVDFATRWDTSSGPDFAALSCKLWPLERSILRVFRTWLVGASASPCISRAVFNGRHSEETRLAACSSLG